MKPGSSLLGFWVAGVLALSAGGAALHFHLQASAAAGELRRAKEDYASMARWRRPVEEMLKAKKTRTGMQESNEDLLTFLDRKARQAQIPQGLFTISRNPELSTGSWKESSYTVTLRPASKEAPVSRDAVIDLLRLVETERRSVKSKNLQVTFAGANLSSATLTFVQFTPK